VLGGPDQIRLLIKKYPEDGGSFSPDLYGLDVRHIMNELQLIIESILNIDHVVYTITDPLNG
jgi:hypothetical protein